MRRIVFMLTTAFLLTACNLQAQDSNSGESTEKSGLILFEKPGKKAPYKSFKVSTKFLNAIFYFDKIVAILLNHISLVIFYYNLYSVFTFMI